MRLIFIETQYGMEVFTSSNGNAHVPAVGDLIEHTDPTFDKNNSFIKNVTTLYRVVSRKFIFNNNLPCKTVEIKCDKI